MQSGLPELVLSPSTVNQNCELDSHADTCHTVIWTMNNQLTLLGMTRVNGLLQNNMKPVSGTLTCDNPTKTVIIVLHQAIHFPTMDFNLIC